MPLLSNDFKRKSSFFHEFNFSGTDFLVKLKGLVKQEKEKEKFVEQKNTVEGNEEKKKTRRFQRLGFGLRQMWH